MTPELALAMNDLPSLELGRRIKAARTAAGMTQPALGGRDASVTYVSRIERGERRPGPALVEAFAARLGVSVEYLVIGRESDDVRRLQLALDHAELALAGGEAQPALDAAREVLEARAIDALSGGRLRARYVEAAALDSLGGPEAAAAFEGVVAEAPPGRLRLRAATALSRIRRERGELDRAVAAADDALRELPEELAASEEAIRLSVTLAAALYMAGHTDEAAAVCDAAIRDAERVSSPVARASAYWNASIIRSEAGDLTEAIELAARALHLLENTERVRDLGRLRSELGHILLRADPPRIREARELLAVADRELEWSDATPVDRGRHSLATARAHFLEGEVDRARQLLTTTLDSLGTDLPLLRATLLTLAGQVEWTDGDREAARGHYRAAIAALTGAGADREAAQLWFELGTLADEAELYDEARDAYKRAAASTGLTTRLPGRARHPV